METMMDMHKFGEGDRVYLRDNGPDYTGTVLNVIEYQGVTLYAVEFDCDGSQFCWFTDDSLQVIGY